MKDYLEVNAITIQETDVVKVDVSPTTFQTRSLNQEVIVSALTYGSNYKVSTDLQVHREVGSELRQWISLGSHSIIKALDYGKTFVEHGCFDSLFSGSTMNFSGYEKTLDLSENRLAFLNTFLDGLSGTVLIEFMYQNPLFTQSAAGEIYNNFLDQQLAPALLNRGYTIIDHRYLLSQSSYIDSNHLNYQSRLQYTDAVNAALKRAGMGE